jgi:hypothetical protein
METKPINFPGLDGPMPEALRKQTETLNKSLGSSNHVQLSAVIPPEDTISVLRRRSQPIEKVELEYVPESNHPAFKLTFNVNEVCIRDNYISLLLTGDMGFMPASMMHFMLKYRDQSWPVIFVGAEFEFQTVQVHGISFLIDKNRQSKIVL